MSAARDLVDFTDEFEPGARERVLSIFPNESRELFLSAPRSSWLPIEHDHWVVDGVVGHFGVERAIECWRASVLDIVDKPLLKSFVSGMLRVFGSQKPKIVGLLPKAWDTIYRDVCKPRATIGDHEGTIVFHALAEEIWTYPNYFHSFHGVVWGLLDLAKLEGSVAFELERDRDRAVAQISWR